MTRCKTDIGYFPFFLPELFFADFLAMAFFAAGLCALASAFGAAFFFATAFLAAVFFLVGAFGAPLSAFALRFFVDFVLSAATGRTRDGSSGAFSPSGSREKPIAEDSMSTTSDHSK